MPKGSGLTSNKKGERRGGRQAGTPNRSTQELKEHLLNAADALGTVKETRRDVSGTVIITRNKGEGGTQGFLEWLAMY